MNTTQSYLDFSTCCNVFCNLHCLGFLERHNTSFLSFIPIWSHAAESRWSVCWRTSRRYKQNQIFHENPTVDPTASKQWPSMTQVLYLSKPCSLDYDEELWRNTPLLKATFIWRQSNKLTQNCVSFNQCINLLVQPSVAREYHHKALEPTHLMRWIAAHLQHTLPWISADTQYVGICSADFQSHLVACSRKPTKCMLRPCSKDASSTKSSAKSKQLILQLPIMTP